MNLNPRLKRKIRISLRLVLFGVSAGLFFVVLSDGIGDWYPLRNGAVIGFVLALSAALFELNIYEKKIRKQRFIVVLAIKSLFYFILIVVVILTEIGIARMLKDNLDLNGLWENEAFRRYVFEGEFYISVFYTFSLALIVNFTHQVSRKLGGDTMISMITGKYYHPTESEKIFMFLNIPTSAQIINQIGRMKFHRFINETVYDITLPILSNFGTIYQYVEDEMVIIWKLKEGIKNANAIRCFFDIKDKIHEQREKYIKKYGLSPVFNAALHCGKAVKGEIGYIKSEVVYHGDVLNTTSRILDFCNRTGNELLVSGDLLSRLDLPVIYVKDKNGDIRLKGKKDAMEIFTVSEADIQSMTFA